MSSHFGQIFQISTFGESHGAGLGVVIDGVPAGLNLDTNMIQKDLDRRRPGTSKYVSQRKETDQVEILSGVQNGKTLGSPIALVVKNKDARSKDYSDIAHLFRPGHADYTYYKKYGLPLQPGGGRSSGRETLARVAAGAVAKALLSPMNINIQAYTISIGDVRAEYIDPEYAETHPLRCADPEIADEMLALVDKVRNEGNSIGGVIQLVAENVPPGLGEPVFHKLDAMLAMALISIGAVKGIEFGAGFQAAKMNGREHNDPITPNAFDSNNAGGILGGISNGDTITMQLSIKPTPSISIPQPTVNLEGGPEMITIKGRHDPCICSRICPVAEAMTAIVLADAFLLNQVQSHTFKDS
ncbi:chorismate synthase [Candidatus Magnetomorum sp. HK-1]|nr:chorismate synthase [Candidatus Magnetomorum sp. HK-1]